MTLSKKEKGISSLITASLLWGTSFPAIKIAVSNVNELTYTWTRAGFALIFLLPYVIANKKKIDKKVMKGGILAGSTYAIGIWLQGWGTRFTTASNSAFITGLYMVFVHAYIAILVRRYSKKLSLSLILALTGLYLLTRPDMHLNVGDFLVLLSAFLWAANILIIDRYADKDPLLITFFEIIPSVFFLMPDISLNGFPTLNIDQLAVLMYLGFVCSDGATVFQVYGQRFIEPAAASVIYLIEPVSASLFSFALLGEVMNPYQLSGATFILLAMAIASTEKIIVKG